MIETTHTYDTKQEVAPLFSLLLAFFLIAGCGYKILKPDSYGVSQVFIAIEPVRNRTAYPELDWLVTDYLIMEMTNWPGMKISPKEKAACILSGEVLFYRSQIPYTYNSHQNPLEYKLQIEMSLSWTSNPSLVIPGDPNISGSASARIPRMLPRFEEEEIYRIDFADLGTSKRAEWKALEQAVRRITRRAMDQFMGTGFPCY